MKLKLKQKGIENRTFKAGTVLLVNGSPYLVMRISSGWSLLCMESYDTNWCGTDPSESGEEKHDFTQQLSGDRVIDLGLLGVEVE